MTSETVVTVTVNIFIDQQIKYTVRITQQSPVIRSLISTMTEEYNPATNSTIVENSSKHKIFFNFIQSINDALKRKNKQQIKIDCFAFLLNALCVTKENSEQLLASMATEIAQYLNTFDSVLQALSNDEDKLYLSNKVANQIFIDDNNNCAHEKMNLMLSIIDIL